MPACVLCLQAATCLKPRSTRPGARLRRAKRGTVFAMASVQVRLRESVGRDVMIVTNHGSTKRLVPLFIDVLYLPFQRTYARTHVLKLNLA